MVWPVRRSSTVVSDLLARESNLLIEFILPLETTERPTRGTTASK